jgi:hypothetical protein
LTVAVLLFARYPYVGLNATRVSVFLASVTLPFILAL